MSHLKTFLSGKAKLAILDLGFPVSSYAEDWSLLERRFGRSHRTVDAQLETLRKQQSKKASDSNALVSYSKTISSCVNVLKQHNYNGELQSNATLSSDSEVVIKSQREMFFLCRTLPGR